MAYEPTHDVPASGLPAFAEPDATPGPAAQLVPDLDVQVLERRDDWAYIECSNGWKAWVNGTLLVARAAVPPPPAPPPPVAAPAPPPPMPTPTASEPSGAWAAPSAPAAAGTSGGLGLGPGHIVALVGAAVVALSTLLNWIDFEGSTASAHNVPAAFLLNTDNAGDGGLGVGWLLILLMVVAAVGVFVERVRWLTIVGGGAAVLVVVLFVFQLNSFVDQVNDQAREFGVDTVGLFDVMTYWPFLTLVGAAAAIVGGVLVLTRPRIAA